MKRWWAWVVSFLTWPRKLGRGRRVSLADEKVAQSPMIQFERFWDDHLQGASGFKTQGFAAARAYMEDSHDFDTNSPDLSLCIQDGIRMFIKALNQILERKHFRGRDDPSTDDIKTLVDQVVHWANVPMGELSEERARQRRGFECLETVAESAQMMMEDDPTWEPHSSTYDEWIEEVFGVLAQSMAGKEPEDGRQFSEEQLYTIALQVRILMDEIVPEEHPAEANPAAAKAFKNREEAFDRLLRAEGLEEKVEAYVSLQAPARSSGGDLTIPDAKAEVLYGEQGLLYGLRKRGRWDSDRWLQIRAERYQNISRLKAEKWSALLIPQKTGEYLDRALNYWMEPVGIEPIALMCRAAIDAALEEAISEEELKEAFGDLPEREKNKYRGRIAINKFYDKNQKKEQFRIRGLANEVAHAFPDLGTRIATFDAFVSEGVEKGTLSGIKMPFMKSGLEESLRIFRADMGELYDTISADEWTEENLRSIGIERDEWIEELVKSWCEGLARERQITLGLDELIIPTVDIVDTIMSRGGVGN